VGVHDYNHTRPHQARDMDTPALHFQPVPAAQRAVLPLWAPPELTPQPNLDNDLDNDLDGGTVAEHEPVDDAQNLLSARDEPVRDTSPSAVRPAVPADRDPLAAVEIDRVVPVSGNLGVCGQQFWLGTQRAGRTVTLWIDTTTVHLAGRDVTIEIDETVLRIYDERGDTLINQVPRTSTKPLARHKAYGLTRNRTTGQGTSPINWSRSVPHHLGPDSSRSCRGPPTGARPCSASGSLTSTSTTCATPGNQLAAEAGATTKELMRRMGHSTVRAAMRYQHSTDRRDRQIAAEMSRRAKKGKGRST
jgi:hypothetical protein